ncbi:uridine kinase [Amycolatopsis sp. NPDC059021]|uniref:uridine kinase family protein n=1 Tax=Amycolatopsis sp. NPDC059021 TaxID=3346704 RepID=UPI00366F64D2
MLAVDGPSGAGKSTFARSIVEDFRAREVPVVLLSTDEFATWNDPVAWWPRLCEGVLKPLSAGSPGAYRRMEWPPEGPRLGVTVTVPLPEVLVLEGVSSGRSSVRPLLSHLCWVDGGDEAARLARSVARDGLDHRADLRRWQLFERGWFAVDGTREAADSHVD